jgi:hypothetical protein
MGPRRRPGPARRPSGGWRAGNRARPGGPRRLAPGCRLGLASALVALVLATVPGFLGLRAPRAGELSVLATAGALGWFASGPHPLSGRARWRIAGLAAAVAPAAAALLVRRLPAARAVLDASLLQAHLLLQAWGRGETPLVPVPAGYGLALLVGAPAAAVVYRAARLGRPLGAVATCTGLLLVEWEFYTPGADRSVWAASALGLAWSALEHGRQRAGPAGAARRPSAFAVAACGLAVAGASLGVARWLPLDRPPAYLGPVGAWIDARFPWVRKLEAVTRSGPGGAGNGPPRVAPVAPYSLALTGFSADDASLGGPVVADPRPALYVTVEGDAPPVLLLRGVAKDVYTGRGWTESDRALDALPGPGPVRGRRRGVYVRVRPAGLASQTLFTLLHPVGVVAGPGRADGPAPGVAWDRLGNAWYPSTVGPDSPYTVYAAAVPAVPYEPLPPAPPRRFQPPEPGDPALLALPASLPSRVVDLARLWTAGQTSDPDRAAAILAHLQRFPYAFDAPAPPPGTDFVDQFLFVTQRGYCTYYASAMAVMLRAVGIPARWVVGFRLRTPPPGQEAVVAGTDAHAWVEAFLQGYGWVAFDPTPWGQPTADTATGASAAAGSGGSAATAETGAGTGEAASAGQAGGAAGAPRLVRDGAVAASGLAALLALVLAARAARLRRLASGDPAARVLLSWRSFERAAARAGRPRHPGETPLAFAAAVAARWPELADPATALARAQGRACYGPPGPASGRGGPGATVPAGDGAVPGTAPRTGDGDDADLAVQAEAALAACRLHWRRRVAWRRRMAARR